jgi:hypothetical protein
MRNRDFFVLVLYHVDMIPLAICVMAPFVIC